MSPSTSTSRLQIAGVVGFYMSAALVMVFVNKAVLNSSPTLPLTFLFIQLIIAIVLLHFSALLFPNKIELPNVWDLQKARQLFAVVSVNIVGLVFNTLCLRDVDASFFQIARGMVLPLTIIVSAINTRVLPSARILLAAIIVTCGFLVGVAPSSPSPASDSPRVAARALLFGFLSSLMIALHAVLIKSSLPHVSNSSIQLAYWTNAGSAAMLAPFVILSGEIGELAKLIQGVSLGQDDWKVFFAGSAVTGLFGFFICVAALISIKVTSPVTHMFSSAARSVLQTLLGVWLFGDIITIARGTSIMVILAGTLYFTWVKSLEVPAPAPSRRADPERDPEALREIGKKAGQQSGFAGDTGAGAGAGAGSTSGGSARRSEEK